MWKKERLNSPSGPPPNSWVTVGMSLRFSGPWLPLTLSQLEGAFWDHLVCLTLLLPCHFTFQMRAQGAREVKCLFQSHIV